MRTDWERTINDLARIQAEILQLMERTSLLYEERVPLMMECYLALRQAKADTMVLWQALERGNPLVPPIAGRPPRETGDTSDNAD